MNEPKRTEPTAEELFAIANGILQGHVDENPNENRVLTIADAQGMIQQARAITADATAEIDLATNDLRDLEGLLIVMQQAYLGECCPDQESTAQALNSVSTSLMKIRRSLDAVLDQIYGRKE